MINILQITDEYLICEKPPNTVSEAGAANSLADAVSSQLKDAGLSDELFAVHRLDKGVGGIILYARTQKEAARLSALIAEKAFCKEYTAVVQGKLEFDSGYMRDLLFYDRQRGKSYVVNRERNGVKKAELEYFVLSYNAEYDISLVKVVLHTGRTHQIRVQFSSRKHMLYGDRRYGGLQAKDIALRCTKLGFSDKDGRNVECNYVLEDSFPWNVF